MSCSLKLSLNTNTVVNCCVSVVLLEKERKEKNSIFMRTAIMKNSGVQADIFGKLIYSPKMPSKIAKRKSWQHFGNSLIFIRVFFIVNTEAQKLCEFN